MELKEAMKKQKEKIERLGRHIRNYEESNCKTAIYQTLIEEKEVLETVLQVLQDYVEGNIVSLKLLQKIREGNIPKTILKHCLSEEQYKKLLKEDNFVEIERKFY